MVDVVVLHQLLEGARREFTSTVAQQDLGAPMDAQHVFMHRICHRSSLLIRERHKGDVVGEGIDHG